ncbi:MAG: hypothetical protein L0Y44_10960 [Phycisphaerales bacterium]|nr:hypothetical protein [Phycisphaerales bacterium]MCI0631158.1 hypothetical protein [Phycisphaerales bacterium]
MDQSLEHNPGDHEDPLSGPTWMVAFLGAVLLAVIMLGLTALYYNANTQEETIKVITRDPDELVKLRQEQLAQIQGPPRYVEEIVPVEGSEEGKREKALVIPIEQAMELVVKEAGASPSTPKRGGGS